MEEEIKRERRKRRHKRVRSKAFGTKEIPRFCVFRSNKHIYAQLIDDTEGRTIFAVSDQELKKSPRIRISSLRGKKVKEEVIRTGKVIVAYKVGELLAKKALEKKIERVVFDRGGYKYHGRVKAVADGARDGGLKF